MSLVSMGRAAALLLVAAVTVACETVAPVVPDRRTSAERAEAKSVSVLSDGSPVCGGVWISATAIVTAAHCVADAGKPEILGLLEMLGEDTDDLFPDWSPVGASVWYSTKGSSAYEAAVERVDKDRDLALLRAKETHPGHDVARISDRTLHDGESLDVVGTTAGLPFSYCRGYVGSVRSDGLQVSAPIFLGNSGGGAFDERGDLVGIARAMIFDADRDTLVPGVGFFVPAASVNEFVIGAL